MRNVFMVYMPPSNHEAMVHYEETIRNRVPQSRIQNYVSRDVAQRLQDVFGPAPVAVWGSQPGPQNQARFDRMAAGDYVLIVEGANVKAIGQVATKTVNAHLARELWKPLKGNRDVTWSLVYFIANARELHVPFQKVSRLFGYSPNYQLFGFSSVSEAALREFYLRYDDLYSVLVRVENDIPVEQKPPQLADSKWAPEELVELEPEALDQALSNKLISDHVRMQFTLARLGIKAGEKVWVPRNDKEKLKTSFGFDAFDEKFSPGLDLPHSYVENIDVIWKREFRIAAAYEIENSTSIYSGLLRFADLTLVAPNTIYPLFVVAPKARKNLLRAQLRRPAFQEMKFGEKVKFLSYEGIEEIDNFFASADSGVTVDIMEAKAERVD